MREHIFMLKCIQKSAPGYLFFNLFYEVISYISFVFSLFFYKVVVDLFLYQEPDLSMAVRLLAVYAGIDFLCRMYQYWVKQIYDNLAVKKIANYMCHLLYGKLGDIDIACYEDTTFYDKYARAVSSMPEGITDAAGTVCSLLGAVLRVTTIVGLFSTLDFLFCIMAVLYCIQALVTTKRMNRIFYDDYVRNTPLNRKSGYINHVFGAHQFAKEIKLYQIHDFLMEKLSAAQYLLRDQKKKAVTELLKVLLASNLFGSCLKFSVNAYVIYKICMGDFTVGDFTLIFASVFALSESLTAILNVIPNIENDKKYIRLIQEILDHEPAGRFAEQGIPADMENIRIALEQVSFSYLGDADSTVLKNVSLAISEGEKIAVVGPNGAGKSTLLNLLLGFYEPSEGRILLNGMEYSMYGREDFYRLFGVVFQSYQIYGISIAANIMLKKELTDREEKLVWEALEFSGLSEKVHALKDGIYTIVTKEFDENGVYFSGGEYQRMAIARAYVKNPRILLFDEPASSLDPFAEREIMDRLFALGAGKTVICVSHRFSSTINADKIIVINDNHIAEVGNHEELMAAGGFYYTMFSRQAEGYRE